VFAVVLIGPPGAGKSSVVEALSDALGDGDVPHAMVETEALTATHPPLDDAQWFAQVHAACGLHRRQGQRLLLVATTVESAADLRGVLEAVGADEHVVVRLEAEPATLTQRIVEREPDGWSGLDELVAASARLGPVIAELDGVALALSTEDTRPADVARRIRDAFPATLRRDGGPLADIDSPPDRRDTPRRGDGQR
jgi:gluconate kinase